MDGMSMMLKSMGIDTGKIIEDFTQLKNGVQTILAQIDERLARIEKAQAAILESQSRLENCTDLIMVGTREHLKLLQEITAWKRIQAFQSLNQPQPQPTAPQPQSPQPQEQP